MKMKKLLALLLAVVMVVSLAACQDNKPVESQPDTSAPESTPTESQKPVETHENKIVYGSTTEISGDFGYALWTNNATDKLIRDLIDDYGTIVSNQDGEYVNNATVVKEITDVKNADGTATFTIKINEGLLWNNGEPITAKDYVAAVLFSSSPVLAKLQGKSTAYMTYVGGAEYYKSADGEKAVLDDNGNAIMVDGSGKEYTADEEGNYPEDMPADVTEKVEKLEKPVYELSGVRLLGDYEFSMSIVADKIPYFFENTYAGVTPMNIPFWFGDKVDVKDDGNGAYFTYDGDPLAFTKENVGDAILAARNAGADRVSAGPYTLKNLDKSALQATLEINPNYAGNFEGQKPSIQTIIIVKAESETWADAMKTGQFDFYDTITDGKDINTALDIIDSVGGFDYVQFDRNGYGKIMFQCDFGPTQFESVRHAIAYLLDRNDFANAFCQGWGTTVDGPYGVASWMYKESKEWLADNLNSYSYNAEKAVQVLEEDGWTLNAEGGEYTSGTRYKKVTAEEAGEYKHNVTLADGTILMPLIIEWASSEGNTVSDMIATKLVQNSDLINAGIVINQNNMSFTELLCWMYRQDVYGIGGDYNNPTYGMYNLATGFTPIYDQSYSFTLDPELLAQGYNNNYILDKELDDLSMDMVYGVEAGDNEGYLAIWQKFIARWNEVLPEIPLYSNTYISMFPDYLTGYDQNGFWDFSQAILYASIEGAV